MSEGFYWSCVPGPLTVSSIISAAGSGIACIAPNSALFPFSTFLFGRFFFFFSIPPTTSISSILFHKIPYQIPGPKCDSVLTQPAVSLDLGQQGARTREDKMRGGGSSKKSAICNILHHRTLLQNMSAKKRRMSKREKSRPFQKVYCSSSWLFFGRIWLMIDN